jgi:predicted exporter
LLSLLVIGVGVMTALAGSLLLFGDLHVGAMLFGVSLIGVAVDYSLQYCTETFTAERCSHRRLRQVVWGISLGTATTVIGYLTLLLAPFPGLRQVAVFSAIGLVAAWLTVVLWLPLLDRSAGVRHGVRMLRWSFLFLWLWQSKRLAGWRIGGLVALVVLAGIGLIRFHTDDDVRRMQALSPDLLSQQARLQALIGSQGGGQFFLVSADDSEAALRTEEVLGDRLRKLAASGALGGFRSPARYVPSAFRQRENRALVDRELGGDARREQFRRLGLAFVAPDDDGSVLTLTSAMRAGGPLDFLSLLVLNDGEGGAAHVVMLDGVRRLHAVAAAGDGIAGVRFVDAAGSFSAVLGQYRVRTMLLLGLSALLMAPLLAWRYGPRRTVWIMLPPVLAVGLTPGLRALLGSGFTFFDGIALVLILSVGVDYAVFLAETSRERRVVTMLAVGLAAVTALMSFGLLALSNVMAVQHFGATMLVGILLAALLAPMARR